MAITPSDRTRKPSPLCRRIWGAQASHPPAKNWHRMATGSPTASEKLRAVMAFDQRGETHRQTIMIWTGEALLPGYRSLASCLHMHYAFEARSSR